MEQTVPEDGSTAIVVFREDPKTSGLRICTGVKKSDWSASVGAWDFLVRHVTLLLSFQYFPGNINRNTVRRHQLTTTIRARYVRVLPTNWYRHISMRVEFYGCVIGKTSPLSPGQTVLPAQANSSQVSK